MNLIALYVDWDNDNNILSRPALNLKGTSFILYNNTTFSTTIISWNLHKYLLQYFLILINNLFYKILQVVGSKLLEFYSIDYFATRDFWTLTDPYNLGRAGKKIQIEQIISVSVFLFVDFLYLYIYNSTY
jgi:hypothetical protein